MVQPCRANIVEDRGWHVHARIQLCHRCKQRRERRKVAMGDGVQSVASRGRAWRSPHRLTCPFHHAPPTASPLDVAQHERCGLGRALGDALSLAATVRGRMGDAVGEAALPRGSAALSKPG